MKISICIPTYNRAIHLNNCLHSIIANNHNSEIDFEVCVSDNCSTDETENIVRAAQAEIEINYHKNTQNLGIPRNFLNVVEMASGDYVWLIGDDDLLLPFAFKELGILLPANRDIDFFYINSFHLSTKYVFSYPQPFSTVNLPADMLPFSTWPKSGKMKFMDLINPKISFDFLGGMYLAVFRRKNWVENTNVLDATAVADPRVFSHFDNTFPHVKIFSRAFKDSNAFFYARPLSVNLSGAREWFPMYPLMHAVRLPEALDEYRKNGLPYLQYIQCKNFALGNFFADMALMFIHKDKSGLKYIRLSKLILSNFLYPNLYLSFFYFVFRKSIIFFKKIMRLLSGYIEKPANY